MHVVLHNILYLMYRVQKSLPPVTIFSYQNLPPIVEVLVVDRALLRIGMQSGLSMTNEFEINFVQIMFHSFFSISWLNFHLIFFFYQNLPPDFHCSTNLPPVNDRATVMYSALCVEDTGQLKYSDNNISRGPSAPIRC